MKSEIKIEFEDSKKLTEFFDSNYRDGILKKDFSQIEIKKSDPMYKSIVDINNGIVRLTNKDVIEGFSRFIISSDGSDVRLTPISINYITIHNRWSFF